MTQLRYCIPTKPPAIEDLNRRKIPVHLLSASLENCLLQINNK